MSHPAPPRWAERFLRWYCNPRYHEEIEGDIYELFDRRIETQNEKTAKLKFIWDVFRFFRWSNIKRSNSKSIKMNRLVLFRNYLKLGFRNMQKNMVSSAINIIGLAVALGITITTFVFIDLQFSMDQYHTKKDRIYQITNYVEEEDGTEIWGDSPMPLGPALAKDHASIEDYCRIEFANANVRYGDNVFEEFFSFADPAILHIFDFPILYGNRDVLKDKKNVVISREMAIKYFDNQDPIGKELAFKFPDGTIKRFVVGAVLAKEPYNAMMTFNFLLSIDNFFDLKPEEKYGWEYLTDATIVLLRPDSDIKDLDASFDRYQKLQVASNPEWKVESFLPISWTEISLRGYEIVSPVSGGSHPAGRLALSVISALLLFMACFNFMNISIASSTKRLKEIALRKAMGGVRQQIVHQFLVENVLQCIFALVLGTLLAYFLFVPGFDALIPPLDIQFRSGNPLTMVIFFASLLVGIGLLSGAYPAFYISKFQPIAIFRGNEKLGSSNLFSKILLGFQLFFAFQTIVGSLLFLDESRYNARRDWGYDAGNTFSVSVQSTEQYQKLRDAIEGHDGIVAVSGGTGNISRGMPARSFEYLDKQFRMRLLKVDDDYFETAGVRLLDGRFLTDNTSDQTSGVVINETFAEQMGWEDPVNKTFVFDSAKHTVVGLVQDFHYYSLYFDIEPVMFKGFADAKARYITIRTKPGRMEEVDGFLKSKWLDITPYEAYDREFQEDVLDDFYQENTANMTIIIVITICAAMLACLGLYGLLAFNIQKKLKEFSIRKVLGANPKSIASIAGKQYSWIVGIAFVIGAPVGILLMSSLINSIYPDPRGVTPFPFVVSFLLIVSTLTITVAGQVRKAVRVNPATNLRSE